MTDNASYQSGTNRSIEIRRAMGFIVLMGMISLFADMTYEGARSLNGEFLNFLGASAATVGIAAGAGELLGYGLRFISGYISDKTHRYWLLTFLGYFINLLAPPLLALVGRWELAVILIFSERIGKAIRNPSRDAMLSHAALKVGSGFGFGLHEALDQIGAILGPLLTAGVLYWKGRGAVSLSVFHNGYAVLFLPALVSLAILALARLRFPDPGELESKTPQIGTRGLPTAYWWYLVAAALVAAGFADFPLIAYHFQNRAILTPAMIPLMYAVAMLVDALAALILGRWFDRFGLRLLAGVFALTACFAPLVFLGSPNQAFLGILVWGVGMGALESVFRAAVSDMAPKERRGTAYGLFYTCFGLSWFLGSVVLGVMYDRSLVWMVILSVVTQIAAIPCVLVAARSVALDKNDIPG